MKNFTSNCQMYDKFEFLDNNHPSESNFYQRFSFMQFIEFFEVTV